MKQEEILYKDMAFSGDQEHDMKLRVICPEHPSCEWGQQLGDWLQGCTSDFVLMRSVTDHLL